MTTLTRRFVLSGSAAVSASAALPATAATPSPSGAVPAPRQLAWHRLGAHAFMHFTINTFTDREWGYGDEDTALFNPTDFSADQIASAIVAGGLNGLILTAKHHDGFCLWPSRLTEHSIRNSPYKNGHGDIVREMAEACHRYGLKFGVYLSPWDRNHAEYGRPAYVEYYHAQLNELTTQYGPLFEVWFDGANGGDGYYGGARERRKIDGHTYYQWDKVREIVRKNQPGAVMFADSDMDIRWVGNEDGQAGNPCWPTWDLTSPYSTDKANRGVRGGPIWNPAEVDVSIRPGWFWHADEAPKSPATLTRLWFESQGRGASLLLNVAPDRRGRVPDADVASLKAWKAIRDKTFGNNLAEGARVTVSSRFAPAWAATNILSEKTAWAAANRDTAAWVRLDLPKPRTFDVVRLSEDIRYGIRVDGLAIDIRTKDGWQEVARPPSVGPERLIRLDHPVTTTAVRVRVLSASAAPILNRFGLFRMPEVVEEPSIRRDAQGSVTIGAPAPGLEIRYTLDGSPPTAKSSLYAQPFALPEGGTVKAIARTASGAVSEISMRDFDLSPARWHITSDGAAAPDGTPYTGVPGRPLELLIDLAQSYTVKGFTLTPAQRLDAPIDQIARMGPPAGYEAWLSDDGKTWGESVASGEFSNIAASRAEQRIRFSAPHAARYLRLHLPNAVQEKPVIVVGAVGIITR